MIFGLLHLLFLTDFLYSFMAFSICPTVSTKYPPVPKFCLLYLYFKLACLSNYRQSTLNPITVLAVY